MKPLSLVLMETAEEWGFYPLLEMHIDRSGEKLASHPDPDVRAAFLALLARAAPMFEIERASGEGSLLNLDHPAVAMMAQIGGYFFGGEVEAARQYRAASAI